MDTVAGTSNGIGRKLLWVLIAILGAVSLGIVALSRGETISAAWLVIAAVCVYLLAYRFYALFIADRVLGVDPSRLTPATVTMTASTMFPQTNTCFSDTTLRPSLAQARW